MKITSRTMMTCQTLYDKQDIFTSNHVVHIRWIIWLPT